MCPVIETAQLLRNKGVQVTAQRVALLRAVSENPHATADELADQVRATIGSISKQAVYDTLSVLAERQLVRRIQPAGSAARYENRVGDNHHHLICRTCGLTFDINCAVGTRPCLTADDDHGFEIDEAEVIYWGRCPSCRVSGPEEALSPAPTTNVQTHLSKSPAAKLAHKSTSHKDPAHQTTSHKSTAHKSTANKSTAHKEKQ
jgi:Fur family transcriptional regulator, stress-responsive regulator